MHQHVAEPTEDSGPRIVRSTGKLCAQIVAQKRPHQLGTPPPTTKRSMKGAYPKQLSKVKSSDPGSKKIAQTLRITKASKSISIEKEAKQPTEAIVSTRLSENTLSTLAAFKYQPEAANDAYGVHKSVVFERMTSAAKSAHESEGNVIDTKGPVSVYHIQGISENETSIHTETHAFSSEGYLPSIEAVHSRSTGSACQITRIDSSHSIQADKNAHHSDTLSSSVSESPDRAVAKILTGAQKTETNQSTSERSSLQDRGYKRMNEVTGYSIPCDNHMDENETYNSKDEQFFTDALFEHKATPKSSPSVPFGFGEHDEYSDEFPTEDLGNEALPPANEVQKSFEPPSDLQLSYNDHDQSSEVYDPNMQRSSPHSDKTFPSFQVVEEMFPGGQQTTVNALRCSGRLFSAYEESSSYTVIENDTGNGYYEDFFDSKKTFEEDFLDDELDAGVLDLADKASKESHQTLLTPLNDEPTTPKLQWRAPQLYKSIRSSPISSKLRESSPVQKSLASTLVEPHPEAERTAPLAKHLIAFGVNGKALPFVRPIFPAMIQDRSPILGLSSSSCLRTCFRIGEALNAATIASHTNMHHLTELYARVTYSKLDGVEQFFQFADLFRPERPPYLNGSYIGWKGSDLWETDTKPFLGQLSGGKIARCIGKMKRDETTKMWKMVVLNIWEATWEDVGYVKGIVCA